MAIFQIKVGYISRNQTKGKAGEKSSKNLSYISRGTSSGRAGKSISYIAREGEYRNRDDLIHYEEKNIPREFSDKENIKIAKEFCEQKFGKDYVYFLGIHNPKGNHPHMHLSVCERKLDGIERDKEKYFKRAGPKNPESGGIRVN